MFLNMRRTRLAQTAVAGAAALLAVAIAACSGSTPSATSSGSSSASASSTAPAVPGGTARVALPAGVTLNWIWPYAPLSKANQYNSAQFENLMFRPLYEFGGNGPSVAVNYPLSVASAPVYSDGGKTVTITMKGWKWSDGETVDASDVVFWLNMMKAEPDRYYGHVPGQLPDNLASYRATGPDTLVLQLKSPVSGIWFTYNQLAEITPMPAAWDVTSASAKAGSGGCATDSATDQWAKCTAVFNFLTAQSENAKTYATNPVWSVVDGPWKLSSFSTAASGPVTSFVPNAAYSGTQRPQLARLTYYAFTDARTEYTALKTGHLDVGYIPPQYAAPVSRGQILPATNPLGARFNLQAEYAFGIQYVFINFRNPTLGPAFRQLYVRQAIQELVDQQTMITSVDRGYGYPTSGGVPTQPSNPWAPSIQYEYSGQGPYPFSVINATSLLASHGWKKVGGIMTCASPGSGATQCGPGVSAGTKLSMTMDYADGSAAFQQEVAIMRSDMAQAGVRLNAVPQSLATITGESVPCKAALAGCQWQLLNVGGRNYTGPGYEPTGEPLFRTDAASNAGSYSDPELDQLIDQTHTSASLMVFQKYATYLAEQLPLIWTPSAYHVAAVSSKLANVEQNPLGTLLPEYWYFTK